MLGPQEVCGLLVFLLDVLGYNLLCSHVQLKNKKKLDVLTMKSKISKELDASNKQ